MVDPGDDQVRTAADQAELGEADAVNRRAVGRIADATVVESDLLDGERRASGDPASDGAAVGVGGDDVDLDIVELYQRPPGSLQRRRPEPSSSETSLSSSL